MTGSGRDWWVTTGPLATGGTKVAGPYGEMSDALGERTRLELAEGRSDLWVDDELAEPAPLEAVVPAVQGDREVYTREAFAGLAGTRIPVVSDASGTPIPGARATVGEIRDEGLVVNIELPGETMRLLAFGDLAPGRMSFRAVSAIPAGPAAEPAIPDLPRLAAEAQQRWNRGRCGDE